MTYTQALTEYRITHDRFDPWGSAMGFLFDLANVLYWERGVCIEDFSPGLGHDDTATEGLSDMSTEDLLRLARLFSRFTGRLDRQGHSY